MVALKKYSKKPLCLATLMAISVFALSAHAQTAGEYTGPDGSLKPVENYLWLVTPSAFAAADTAHTLGPGHYGVALKTAYMGSAATYNDFHLTVRTLEGIDSAIFTVVTSDNIVSPKPNSIHDTTLTINLANHGKGHQEMAGGQWNEKGTGYAYYFANIGAAGTQAGNAYDNDVLITDSDIKHTADARQMIIHAATIADAYSDDGKPKIFGNNVTVRNSEIISENAVDQHGVQIGGAYVYSSYSDTKSVEIHDNFVHIEASKLDVNEIFGASSNFPASPVARKNFVSIVNGSTIGTSGLTSYTDVAGQILVGAAVIAGSSGVDEADTNSVTIENSDINHDLFYHRVSADRFSGPRYLNIAGAHGANIAKGNTVSMTNVNIAVENTDPNQSAVGELGEAITLDKGIIRISGATLTQQKGIALNPTATGNSVVIDNLNTEVYTQLFGAMASRTSSDSGVDEEGFSFTNNGVQVAHSQLGDADIYGGAINAVVLDEPDATTKIDMEGNSVTLTDVSANKVNVYGSKIDYATNATATGNTITVEGGSYDTLNLVGSWVSNAEGASSANSNEITVKGNVKVANGSIYGGYVNTASADSGEAKNNTVTLAHNGALKLKDLYGGYTASADGYKLTNLSSGNTLNLQSGLVETERLNGFQNYNFYISQSNVNSTPLIQVTGGESVLLDGQSTKVGIGVLGDFSMQPKEKVTLIQAASGFVDAAGAAWAAGTDLSGMYQSVAVTSVPSLVRIQTRELALADGYELKIDDADKNALVFNKVGGEEPTPPKPDPTPDPTPTPTPSGDRVNPETDALMQSSLSVLGSMFASDDLLIDTALKSRNGRRLDGPFVAARAGTWGYDAKDRMDVDVYSAVLGWAVNAPNVEFGPFVEMGHSNYETRTNVEGSTKRGDGKHNYVGLGMYASWQTPFYVNLTGYLKGGVMENHYDVSMLGRSTEFDRSSMYWGAHLGANLDLNLTEKLRARPFVSYFYDGRESETYHQRGFGDVSGAYITYEGLDAHRVQVGSMFEYAFTNTARPYFGVTYEQIIKADARGSAIDSKGKIDLNAADLEGGTGIISAGWSYLNETKDFEFNFGVNGYGGTRNGVSAQMNANWLF